MSTKIKLYDKGDCVKVNHWGSYDKLGFFESVHSIGLVLEAVLVEMDSQVAGLGVKEEEEWLYRIILPDGTLLEAWDYEITPVNVMGKEYN